MHSKLLKYICCSSNLSLLQFLFSFVLYSLSYITIPKKKKKIKIDPRIKLNHNIYTFAVERGWSNETPKIFFWGVGGGGSICNRLNCDYNCDDHIFISSTFSVVHTYTLVGQTVQNIGPVI